MSKEPAKPRSRARPGSARRQPRGKQRAPRPARPTAASSAQRRSRRSSRSRLKPQELQTFRQLLLQKRAEILGDLGRMQDQALGKSRQAATGDLSSMPVHMADIGTDNYEQEFTLGLLQAEQQLLREIDEALSRIDQGTYGICLATGKPISKTRLRARPWARYCIEYARMQERGRVRPAGQ